MSRAWKTVQRWLGLFILGLWLPYFCSANDFDQLNQTVRVKSGCTESETWDFEQSLPSYFAERLKAPPKNQEEAISTYVYGNQLKSTIKKSGEKILLGK